MPGTINVTLIATGAQAAASVINAPISSLETEINKHLNGTTYRHTLTEHDSPIMDEVLNPVALSSSATDMFTRGLQWQTLLAKLFGGTGNVWSRYSALPVGADNTSLYTILNARTAAATASTTMARDANARTGVGGLDVTLSQTSGVAVNVTGIAAQTGAYESIKTSAAVNVRSLDSSGNQVNAGTITATGFIGPLTGNASTASVASAVSAAAVGTAGLADSAVTGGTGTGAKIAPRTIVLANIADGAVTAQGTPNMTVQVVPITALNSSRVLGTVQGTSPTYPALPAGGTTRQDLLYYDDTFSLGWKIGTPSSGTPTKPVPDLLTTGLAWVLVGNTTTAITQGMITDARTSPGTGGGSGGSGGGGVDLTGKPFLTIGNDGTLTNETDVWGLYSAAGLVGTVNGKDISKAYIHTSRIRSSDPATVANTPPLMTSAPFPAPPGLLANDWGGLEQNPGAKIVFSGLQVSIYPCTIAIGGVMKTRPTYQTKTVSVANGPWYIWADASLETDDTFDLNAAPQLPSGGLTTNQRLLCIATMYNGTFYGDPFVDWTPIGTVTSTQMRPLVFHREQFISSPPTINSTNWTEIAQFTSGQDSDSTVILPRTMKLVCNATVRIASVGTPVAVYALVYMLAGSTQVGQVAAFNMTTATAFDQTLAITGVLNSVAPGYVPVKIFAAIQSTGSFQVYSGSWNITAWGI